jgi:hypothetical protein
MRKKVFGFIISILLVQGLFAQENKDSLVFQFHPTFGKVPLQMNKKYSTTNGDTLQINLFKIYVSEISVHYSDKTLFKQKNSYHLIDFEDANSLTIPLCEKTTKAITEISFNIGIDSLANVSGALSGDLDPTKGMYWAWQSGYINMKIEGISPSCKTRKNAFQFHIGGYLKPNNALRKVVIKLKSVSSFIPISIDLAQIFSNVTLSKTNSIMIPGTKAMEIADYSVTMFTIE